VPALTPITRPELLFTVATEVALVLQVPPGVPVASDNCVVLPLQTVVVPVIVPATTAGFTVILAVAVEVPHAFVTVYVIVEVPEETPVTIPFVELTVATAGLLLLQVPPLPVLVNGVVKPEQTLAAPLAIPAFGAGVTMMIADAMAFPQVVDTV
jgi:hypothetical protein